MTQGITSQHVRGAAALVQDAVEAAASAAERTHRQIAHRAYAAIGLVPCLAAPVAVVEGMQATITDATYTAVRHGIRLTGNLVTAVLDAWDSVPPSPR